MNGLEKLVPPPEECENIPAIDFLDSVLVHGKEHGVITRCRNCRHGECNGCPPAPALEEILDAIALLPGVRTSASGFSFGKDWYDYPTDSTAALRLWMRLRKEAGK